MSNINAVNVDSNKPNVMNNEQFELFVRGTIRNLMDQYNLQSIRVDDGCGKKGVLRKTSTGEVKLQVTLQDTI